jgi:hypothetical protein
MDVILPVLKGSKCGVNYKMYPILLTSIHKQVVYYVTKIIIQIMQNYCYLGITVEMKLLLILLKV